jgi:hypothetical protein
MSDARVINMITTRDLLFQIVTHSPSQIDISRSLMATFRLRVVEPNLYISAYGRWPDCAKGVGKRSAGRVRVLDEREGASNERRILSIGIKGREYVLQRFQSKSSLPLTQ